MNNKHKQALAKPEGEGAEAAWWLQWFRRDGGQTEAGGPDAADLGTAFGLDVAMDNPPPEVAPAFGRSAAK